LRCADRALKEATRIIAIRHGQTAWNAETRMQGQLDTALDALGSWQAQQLAQALAHEPIDAIVASDLSRAMRTAAPLAAARGLRVQPERGLRERCFGVFEGFPYSDIGESLRGFYDRCVAVAERLAEQHAGSAIVWVTHGGVLDCLYRAAARMALDAPRTWTLDNASINRLLHGDQGLMLIGWGDIHHLDQSPDDAREA